METNPEAMKTYNIKCHKQFGDDWSNKTFSCNNINKSKMWYEDSYDILNELENTLLVCYLVNLKYCYTMELENKVNINDIIPRPIIISFKPLIMEYSRKYQI